METPLHDLVIRTILEYIRYSDETAIRMIRLSRRFYELRDIFFGKISLSSQQSEDAYREKPFGWNKVYHMHLVACTNISELGGIHILLLSYLPPNLDLSPLKTVRRLILSKCYHLVDSDFPVPDNTDSGEARRRIDKFDGS